MLPLAVMKASLVSSIILAAALLTGCVTIDPAAERADLLSQAADHAAPVAPVAASLPGPDAVISETDAAAIAIARSPRLRAMMAEAGLARADWARAVSLPDLAVEATWFNPDGEGAVLDLDLRAPVAALLLYPVRREAARARYDAARRQAVSDAIDFAAQARLAWVDAVAARERASLAERALQSAEAALLVAEEIDAAGNAPAFDLARQRLMTLERRALTGESRLASETAALDLAALLTERRVLPDRLPDPVAPDGAPSPDAAADAAVEASLALAAARSRADAAAQEAGYENLTSLIGDLELGPAFDFESGETETGVSMHGLLPVFNLGHPARMQARIRALQAADQADALEADIRAMARAQVEEMRWAAERARLTREEILPAAQANMDAAMRQYNAMQMGVFALLDAYERQLAAGEAWIEATARHHRARIALMRMLQGGSAGAPESGAAAPVSPASGGSAEEGH